MPVPVIAAAVAGAATIGGAVLGSKSQKSAAKTAAQTAQQNTTANNALARETRDIIRGDLQPYSQSGAAATGAINSLLGITPQQPVGIPSQSTQQYGQPVPAGGFSPYQMFGQQPNALPPQMAPQAPQAAPPVQPGGPNFTPPPAPGAPLTSNVTPNRPPPAQTLQSQQQTQALSPAARLSSGVSYDALSSGMPTATNLPGYSGPMQTNVNRASPIGYNALSSGMLGTAMNPGSLTDFRKSTGYEFRRDEGNRNVMTNAAATGSAQSGAAMKALQERGQNLASAEYGNYINQLGNFIGYNDAFRVNERGYADNLARDNRNFAFGEGQYLDAQQFAERGYADQRGQYLDQFDFTRGAYGDQFDQNERGYRNALAQYDDQFNINERGFQTGREDYGRAYMSDQQRYADAFDVRERDRIDARGDYARAYDFDLGRYGDVFGQGERGYQDSRLDYNRAYTDSRQDTYLNQLMQQQGVGMAGVSALAGVGQNYLSNVTANNNSAASAAANAALASGAANQQMWAGIAGGVGNALGTWQMGGFGGAQKPAYPGTPPYIPPYYPGGTGGIYG